MLRSIIAAAAQVLLRFSAASAQQPPDLSLREVYSLALERNPMVQAAHAAADATAARQSAAVLPPDPELRIGAMNLSLPSLSADMPGAMAPSVELMQMLPRHSAVFLLAPSSPARDAGIWVAIPVVRPHFQTQLPSPSVWSCSISSSPI